MAANPTPAAAIVDALETAREPLERSELRERTDLSRDSFDTALGQLRGQEVVRKLGETNTFRLTYWPDHQQCALCDEDITSEEYYELELRAQGSTTESQTTASIHTRCAEAFLDDLSLIDGQ